MLRNILTYFSFFGECFFRTYHKKYDRKLENVIVVYRIKKASHKMCPELLLINERNQFLQLSTRLISTEF